MVKAKVYALLIGINEYDYFETEAGQYNLDGCIRDSQAVADYLKENVAEASDRLFIRNLHSPISSANTSEGVAVNCASEEFFQATRLQIIAGFQDFLTQATAEDTVLIYFSGHGLTYDQPEELWHLAQENNGNHKGQALMCADTYTVVNDNWIPTLKDWDIRWLMHQIVGREGKAPHIIMLSDCCHSGGNTRDFNFDQRSVVKIRGLSDLVFKGTINSKNIAEFIFYNSSKKTKKLLKKHPGSFDLPHVRHVALSAAHNYELAKEMEFPEGTFGIFTYYLLKTLRATDGQISYRDLIKIIRAKTSLQINFQTPQYYATQITDADLLFLGGAIVQQAPYFIVRPMEATDKQSFDENIGIMDGGALHGIPLEKEGLTTVTLASPINNATPKLFLEGDLIQVGAQESIVRLTSIFPKNLPYLKAKIINTPIPKTKIFITTEGKQSKKKAKGVALLKKALEKTIFLEIVQTATAAEYGLIVYLFEGQEKYRITKVDQSEALVAPKIGFKKTTAAMFVKEMEHIARWKHIFQLRNRHPTIIKDGDIELIAIDESGNKFKGGLVNLTATENYMPELRLKVKMKNKKQVPLYCALLHLTSNYGIETNYLAPETQLGKKKYKDDAKKIKWKQWEVFALSHIVLDGQTHPTGLSLGFTISDEKIEQGIRTTDDHFKLIVSTEQFDARHLYQGNLASPKGKREMSTLPVPHTLEAITEEIQIRKKKKSKKSSKKADWWTSMLTVRTTQIS